MLGSAILDTAIGMILLFLLLSLIVTAVQEMLAGIFQWRSRNLHRGLRELLGENDASAKAGKGKLAEFYAHPLILSLSRGPRAGPSYIPSRTFALVLLDLMHKADSRAPLQVDDIRRAIEKLPVHLKRPLLVLLNEAGHDVERFTTQLEIWFNGSMERVAGWYKRDSQFVLFAIAFVVAVLFNADSIHFASALARDQSLRAAIISHAQARAVAPPPSGAGATAGLAETVDQLKSLRLPIGWDAEPRKEWGALACFNRLCGWILTALAVSLGAPFWFDLLNRFMNIRASGKAPNEEPKKPREEVPT